MIKNTTQKAKRILFGSFKQGASFAYAMERVKRKLEITQDLHSSLEAKWKIWNLFPYLNGIEELEFGIENSRSSKKAG